MRGKRLLAAFLLGVGLCFVPALGYGEVNQEMDEEETSLMRFRLLWARVNYIMDYPTTFLRVNFIYDRDGTFKEKFPESVDTKGKICVRIVDTREVFKDEFFHKSKRALLEEFKEVLETVYWYIEEVATDMNADVVAKFESEEGPLLAYFYQGEYHLCGGNK